MTNSDDLSWSDRIDFRLRRKIVESPDAEFSWYLMPRRESERAHFEQVGDGKWQLTEQARNEVAAAIQKLQAWWDALGDESRQDWYEIGATPFSEEDVPSSVCPPTGVRFTVIAASEASEESSHRRLSPFVVAFIMQKGLAEEH